MAVSFVTPTQGAELFGRQIVRGDDEYTIAVARRHKNDTQNPAGTRPSDDDDAMVPAADPL
jgi:hypothetical protein